MKLTRVAISYANRHRNELSNLLIKLTMVSKVSGNTGLSGTDVVALIQPRSRLFVSIDVKMVVKLFGNLVCRNSKQHLSACTKISASAFGRRSARSYTSLERELISPCEIRACIFSAIIVSTG